jgi:hypothetical protein
MRKQVANPMESPIALMKVYSFSLARIRKVEMM